MCFEIYARGIQNILSPKNIRLKNVKIKKKKKLDPLKNELDRLVDEL